VLVPLKFRHRIGFLVVLAAAGLVTVTAVTLVLGQRGEHQLAGIETRYVPLIELDRDLKTLFAQIPHALEDAATAADEARLRDADALYAAMIVRLSTGRHALLDNGGDPAALDARLRAYYSAARAVAAAIVAGRPTAQIGGEIEAMRRAHQTFATDLDVSTTPDRRRLTDAFAAARASQREAIWIDVVVATSALVLIMLLSRRIIRSTVSSLQAVTRGVERLARGDFGSEIDVTTRDELGDLAREANQTAVRLREYHDQLSNANATLETRNATLVAAQLLLEDRAADLARASRYKSEFLANMSHELRTPLNSIMILSQVLAEDDDHVLTGKQIEFATLINRSGEELLALINEVLDFAKVESGKQVLEFATLKLADLQHYVRRMFEPLATQKQLGFAVEAAGELPATIRTDWTRLAQILRNLIANAFKFTERGEIVVRIARPRSGVTRRADGAAIPDPIVISVSDTGIGIAADNQAWIFEAFAQAETGTSRKFGGTGLGLAIARQLAMLLGGDLTVESTLGAGSTFSLVIPAEGGAATDGGARRPAARSGGPALPPWADDRLVNDHTPSYLLGLDGEDGAHEPGFDGRTVMIVDDDMRNVYSLSSALRSKRLHVITAADGQEALDELDRCARVDVVLMDVMMPRMDGHEATRRIRAQPRFRDLPIIAITAQTMAGDREKCIAAGASDYIAKPLDFGQLLRVLRTWLI
jgi:signal transduction histidine kinase